MFITTIMSGTDKPHGTTEVECLNYLRTESRFCVRAHVNERSVSINGDAFLDKLSANWLLRKMYNNNATF
jgi:hypothetical protein